jgi:hypothetical protein
MANLALACVATAEAALQAKTGVNSMFAKPRMPELPNNLTMKCTFVYLEGKGLIV